LLIVILNSAKEPANQGDVERHIADLFRAEGMEVRVISSSEDAIDSTVREMLGSKPEAIVAGGGDGTISTVAGALTGGRIPLGILPLGTFNHFAKDLRIPIDLAQAVKTIAAGITISVDAARVNDRVFVNNSSIGIYPNIVEMRDALRRQGHRKWPAFVRATANIVFTRSQEVGVRLDIDGRRFVTRTPFVFVGNNEYQSSGIHLGARARLNAGRLFVYLAPRVKTRELPKLALFALVGRAGRRDPFQSFSAAELWIETPENRHLSVSTDGEVAMMATPLHYKNMPGALNVFVPPEVATGAGSV
jgi:diacylglycerol kinase family enzyme